MARRKARGSQADAFYGSQAYHGYLIGSTLTGHTFIEKDGFLIAWAKNLRDAMRQIDQLTAPNPISHRKALRYATALAAHERASMRSNPFRPAFRAGERVEIAPHFDAWMRGDRYGEVVKHSQRFGVYVKMDKSGKTLRFAPDDLTPLNPPTRKAQAFIGRKIRRLAHEGMKAPRRVAAAYAMARRAGFKVPKRARKNPYSETDAWYDVLRVLNGAKGYLQSLPASYRPDASWFRPLNEAVALAGRMLKQVRSGVHENPTLAVLGNPPARVVGTLSRRLYELRYKHAGDGKDYRHPFGPGASVKLLADGSVWITSRQRLWEDL